MLFSTGYEVVPSGKSDKSQLEGMLLLQELQKRTRPDDEGCS